MKGHHIMGLLALLVLGACAGSSSPVEVQPGLRYDPFGADRNCGDFRSQPEAQAFFDAAGGPAQDRHRLDGDRDGIACESLSKLSESQPVTRRGFFVNGSTGEPLPPIEDLTDPILLAIAGLVMTFFATFVQLVRGR